MTKDDLKKIIKDSSMHGIFLFEGEEENQKENALAAVRAHFLPEGMELMNETVSENASLVDVLDASRQVPFMSEKRLVIAKDPTYIMKSSKKAEDEEEEKKPETPEEAEAEEQALNSEENALRMMITEDNPECITIIYMRGKMNKSTSAGRMLKNADRIVSFEPLDDYELAKIMVKTAKKEGYTISLDVATMFVSFVGNNLTKLNSELDKLIGYKNGGTEIYEEDVLSIITQNIEELAFQITDSIAAGRHSHAYQVVYSLLERGEAMQAIYASLNWQVRMLCHCAVLKKAGVRISDAAVKLKSKEYPVKKCYNQCERVPVENLVQLYRVAIRNEFDMKSGKMRADSALHDLLQNMCLLIVRK